MKIIFFLLFILIIINNLSGKKETKMNHLKNEKSPYLIQHRTNPVNWYPWGKEAFKKAKDENKPIFLSIGYSTCHWCHVMEKESFTDKQVSKLLNDNFISIKVDREERPDIDNVYMKTCVAFTGTGGWPLSIFMTPDKIPFFAATYIPKNDSYGRIGLLSLIPKISYLWKNENDKILKSTDEIIHALNRSKNKKISSSDNILEKAFYSYSKTYDHINGGFGTHPKFPSPHNLMFLLRYYSKTNSKNALLMVENTLKKMYYGGIFDHVDGGFHRYSTDSKWLVPHFEKMLYDQALISIIYLEAFQVTKNELYKEIAEKILNFVMSKMTDKYGGFYTAFNADTNGIEGDTYLWNYNKLDKILTNNEFKLLQDISGIKKGGNFESSFEENSKNIINITKSFYEIANEIGISEKEVKKQWVSILSKLSKARAKKPQPDLDDKILSDLNGMMIAAFSKGYSITDNKLYLNTAKKAANFILKKLVDKNGNLLHRFRDGESKINGFIDDYAYFTWGLIELFEANQNIHYLKNSIKLSDKMISQFWDNKNFGFYFSSINSEKLFLKTKKLDDNAIPSGNSIALLDLIKLQKLTGNKKYKKYIKNTVDLYFMQSEYEIIRNSMFLSDFYFYNNSTFEILITSKKLDNKTKNILKKINSFFIPNKTIIVKTKENETDLKNISPFTKNISFDKNNIYICKNFSCSLPENKIETALMNVGIIKNIKSKKEVKNMKDSIYGFEANSIDGKKIKLDTYKNKLILIVNTASKCGFTYQYEGLEKLYKKYKDRGFVILGFPANNFLWQEPGTNSEIKQFCKLNYGVTFPMFEKISVTGKDKHPLYKFLTSKKTNNICPGRITWNFNKFLIGKDGKIITRFGSRTKPESAEIIKAIEERL